MKRFTAFTLVAALFVSPHLLADTLVKFQTNLGSFTVELNEEDAPISSANFLKYVEDGSYQGSIFHRVIENFMVQGGGFNENMQRLPTEAPIVLESKNGLKNTKGSIAMARTQDPNSATRQFFINLVDNAFLDYDQRPPGYAVFGQVTEGLEVIEKIGKQPTGSRGRMQDVPTNAIIIQQVSIVK